MAALLGGAVCAAAVVWYLKPQEPRSRVEFAVYPPPETSFVSGGINQGNSAISPDGKMLAFSARTRGKVQIWIRHLDSLASKPVAGTEGGYNPFWAPDSRRLGFVTADGLKKADVFLGGVEAIATLQLRTGGASWNRNDVIIFVGPERALMRVSASGGQPDLLAKVPLTESGHYWPYFLPDGRHYLFTVRSSQQDSGIYVSSLDAPDRRQRIVEALSNAVFSPSGKQNAGNIIYARDGALYSQTFDASTFSLSRDPVMISERVSYARGLMFADFSVSETGCWPTAGKRAMTGRSSGVTAKANQRETSHFRNYRNFFFGLPDEKRLAYVEFDGTSPDVWVGNFENETTTRLTFARENYAWAPVWDPTGKLIYYRTSKGIYRKPADGSGDAVPVLLDTEAVPNDISRDGKFMILTRDNTGSASDLVLLA